MAALIDLYGLNPVSTGLAEWDGLGKGGRGSPGLQAISVKEQSETYEPTRKRS